MSTTFPQRLFLLFHSSTSYCRLVRPGIYLRRQFCGTFAWWPSFFGSHCHQELVKMADKNEPPDWKHIPCSFDHTGKKHILPVSLLMQLTSVVKEKKDLFASQVLKEGLISASTSLPAVGIEDIDGAPECPDLAVVCTELTSKESSCQVAEKLNNVSKRGQQGQDETSGQEKKLRKLTEWKPKRNMKQDSSQDLPDGHGGRAEKKRPNFFVAVQITNPKILSVAREIQLGIQAAAKVNLRDAIIGGEKFHITLMVMHLPDKEGVQKAVESLNKCVPCILERTCGQPITLDFEGLSTFNGGRVLFSPPKASQGLEYLHFLADEVSAQMKVNGIVSTDRPDRQFNPHLTLLKFEYKKASYRRGIKKVEASQYQPYVNDVIGTQTIHSLQLCHMDKKRADGYYFVEHEAFFTK